MDTTKEIVFKTKITKQAGALMALPFLTAFVLLYFAADAGSKFGPNDPTRFLFVGVPAVIACTIVLATVLICNHFLNRTISLTKDEIKYQDSKVMMTLDIVEMAFSPPAEDAKVKTLMFSDGQTFVQIPEIFMGEKSFRQLNDYIKRRRRDAIDAGQKTYSL